MCYPVIVTPGRPLSVCHLGKFYPPATGGMETHVQTLARAQARRGAKVHVICVNHQARSGNDVTWRMSAKTPELDERDGEVRVTRVGRVASISRFDVCPSLLSALDEVGMAETDIVHVHAPNPTMFVALALARQPGRCLVVTHHSDIVKQRALGVPFAFVERRVHARAARVFATSASYIPGSAILRRLGAKVRPLPLGLDIQPFLSPSVEARAYACELRAAYGTPLWLAVGRLVYYKGLASAIDALVHVPGHLLIVGRGPLRDELQLRATTQGVANRITWVDYLSPEQLVGAYHAASALWFPSNARSEAFGLAQVESMASGCPVLNMSIPQSGVSWVAPDQEAALTSPVDDVQAFANAARRILAEPDLRARLAAGGVRRATTEFNHRTMAERSLSLYREALEETTARLGDTAAARSTSA